ncbi:hypothetical protein OAJ57_01260 [Alphaproteobacteria bacterium]|nr:hypothetical protein [Alphaproteobacteria bacterium]
MRETGIPVAVTDAAGNKRLGGIRHHVGERTSDQNGAQTCVIVLGHTQRGGRLMP